MAPLTEFGFFFCPALYCHPRNLDTLPDYSLISALPDKYRNPLLNRRLFSHYDLTAEMTVLSGLQRAILLSDTGLQRFLTFCGCCFYLPDLMTHWPVPARRHPFSALTPEDAGRLLNWQSGLLLPLHNYQRSLTHTDQDNVILRVTGRQLWFYLLRESHEQFHRRAELRFPDTVPLIPFPSELTTFLNTLCRTILQALTVSDCPSAA